MIRTRHAALRLAFTAAVALPLVAACSSGSSGPKAATTSSTIYTTTTSGRPAPTTTTLAAQPAAGTIPFIVHATSSPPDGVSAAGSGCTPPSATTLPNGRWFGLLKSVGPNAGTIGLDLACFYGGTAANAAAKAAGLPVPVPNDNYIRNTNPNIYTLRAVSDVAVGRLGANGSAVAYYPTAAGLAAATPMVSDWVWVQVDRDWVIAIQQQYIP